MSWLDRVLRSLGFNPVRLRWRWHRLRERSKRRARQAENESRALRYSHQLCAGCGLTVDGHERRCPRCGGRLYGPWARRLLVAWRYLVPTGSYSSTAVLVGLILVLYAAMLTQKETSTNVLATLGGGVPLPVLERFGAWTVARVGRGEVWRLLTSCLLHFGLLHLIFNVLWLVQLGPMVEQVYGRSKFIVLTLVSGVFGMALSLAYRSAAGEPAIGAGASGIVFGLIGVALVRGYLKKSSDSERLKSGIGKWALYAIVLSLLPGVDLVAHLGGGATGAALALVLAGRDERGLLPRGGWLALELVCLCGLALSFITAL